MGRTAGQYHQSPGVSWVQAWSLAEDAGSHWGPFREMTGVELQSGEIWQE